MGNKKFPFFLSNRPPDGRLEVGGGGRLEVGGGGGGRSRPMRGCALAAEEGPGGRARGKGVGGVRRKIHSLEHGALLRTCTGDGIEGRRSVYLTHRVI